MMKVSKYRLNGTTHMKGITATSWQTWLVVASSIALAQAGSITQSTRRHHCGRAASGVGSAIATASVGAGASLRLRSFQAMISESTAKRINPADQIQVCSITSHFTSTKKG